MENTDFESCKKMIYKLAHKRLEVCQKAGRTDIEYEELIGQGMEIYCWCLQNYKDGKGTKFTTYLYTNLAGRLRDYCRDTLTKFNYYEDMNFVGKDGEETRYEDRISSPKYERESFFDSVKDKLSYEAIQVLKYIVNREWEDKSHKNKPSMKQIINKFGYTKELVDSIMGEIKSCWMETALIA